MSDSEKYFTKTVDGQLSVATVAQTGEIIPEESRPGDKYTTAMVQTSDGPQLCVKTYDLNGGGGGGGGTVDQTYDPTSTNAQSGTAVAEAVAPSLRNKVVEGAERALVINPSQINDLGTAGITYGSILINTTNQTYGLNINQTVVGSNAGGDKDYITCVGQSAQGYSSHCTAIGSGAYTLGGTGSQGGGATAVGDFTNATHGTALGSGTHTSMAAIAIGRGYNSSHRVEASGARSIAIGVVASTDDNDKVEATAQSAIQLGNGVNSTANSFQVYEYQMLDGTTGKIPAERLPGTYVHAVLTNFELHDRTSSGPAIPSNPKIGQEQCVYDFTDNTSVKIDNILAQASSLTSFDIVTSVMQTSSPGSATDGIISILQQDSTNNATLRLTKDNDGLLRLRVSSDVTSETQDIDITSNSAVVVNSQKVWLKVSYSSTTGYKVLSSADGSTWTEVMSSSSTATLDNTCDNIQFGRNGTSYFKGIFYMRDTYININGQTVYKAVNIGKIPMIWD